MNSSPPVATGTMFRYGLGGVGWEVFRDTPALLLPVFLITVLGVEPWLAGACILIPKLWIMVWDPLVGMFADRHKSPRGYQPFLLMGALLTALGFVALFVPPPFPTPYWAAAYALAVFGIASMAFSAFSVPYLTMVASISADRNERTKILAFRQVFANIGLLLGVGLAPPLVAWAGGGRAGYTTMALTLGAALMISLLCPALGVKAAPPPTDVPPAPILTQFREAARNRAFVSLSAAFFSFQLGQGCAYSVMAFYFIYVVENTSLMILTVIFMCAGAILSQPVAVAFAKRFGKVTAFQIGVVLWGLLSASWWLTGGDSIIVATVPGFGPVSLEVVAIAARSFCVGISGSFFTIMPNSLLTDVIKYDRETYGGDRGGTFAGLFSAVEKLAFAAAPLVTGMILSISGFAPSVDSAAPQTAAAITGVLICKCIAPPAIASFSLLLIKRHQRQSEALARGSRDAAPTLTPTQLPTAFENT